MPCKLKHAGWPTELDSHRWGVILAGGDGKRLLSLTRCITGDDRPKQFCALTGGDTLLRQTRQRVGRAIPRSQTLLVLTRTHERYYADEATGVPSSCLLIQPHNPSFSQEVLSARPCDLAVIRARSLGWSDLGEPERVSSVLRFKSEAANGEG